MYVVQTYTFSPGGPGQGTIEIPETLQLEDFGTIINVSRNSVIYNPAEGGGGATLTHGIGTTTLTLEQSTTYCDSGDKLQISILPTLVDGKVPVDIGTNIDVTIDNTSIEVSNDIGNPVPVSGTINTLTGLSIPGHNYIGMSYTGSNLTQVTYKSGGSGGTTVATLTLAYDGNNNLTSVTKS